ncbi:anaphase-promoting complex subunit 4 [Ischnura elegans]|uniref:anaphase-promoting complex subunit 4 n=1 Tax=Ischnura elegans TaxID=197161 RepID=UPI001ED8BC24|nr:anaphase-promoting complex subunit 4 [Ischnura elegans]
MSSSNAMRQLEERHVANEVDLMVWSNRMDLLALSNVRGEVALHRLSWQRVWCLAPPSEECTVKGIAWRPDGKVIAIGYSTGEYLLVDVENAEALHSVVVDAEITCLSWTQETHSQSEDASSIADKGRFMSHRHSGLHDLDNPSTFLSKLPSLSRNFGSISKSTEESSEDAKKIRDQTHVNILIIGTSTGKVFLSVFGLFLCGIVDMKEHLKSSWQVGKILDADFSSGLETLYVVMSCARSDDKSSDSSEPVVALLDTTVLSSHAAELHSLALMHGQVIGVMGYLAHTMRSVADAWENILFEMDTKLASYAASVPEGAVAADFLDLLMFGVPSDELEAFLLHQLTEKGLKRLGHAIELSYTSIQRLVLRHARGAGNALAFHLAKLKGLAGRRDRFAVLGLEEDAAAKALGAIGAFLAKAGQVQTVIDRSMKDYKAFFRWLYVVILRLSDERVPPEVTRVTQQDLAFVAEFLKNFEKVGHTTAEGKRGHFDLEHLGKYLFNKEPFEKIDGKGYLDGEDSNQWMKLLKACPCLEKMPGIYSHDPNTSLTYCHEQLKLAVDKAFTGPQTAIGSLITISRVFPCALGRSFVPMENPHWISHVRGPEGKKNVLYIAFPEAKKSSECFWCVEVSAGADPSIRGVVFNFNPPHRVLDLQFYSPDILSILLERKEASVLVQLPTRIVTERMGPWGPGWPQVDEVEKLLDPSVFRPVGSNLSARFAVSGARKVAVVLSESRRRVRLFEMEVEEEDEEEDEEEEETTGVVEDEDANEEKSAIEAEEEDVQMEGITTSGAGDDGDNKAEVSPAKN